MLTASTVVGAVAGGAAGANVASTATKFNYLSHADRQKLKDAEKNCMHTGERSACDTAMTLKLQDEQTNAYVQSAVANCEGAQCAEVMNFLQRERTSLGCPASVVVVCQDAPTLNEAWKVASEKAQGLEPVYPESWLADGKLLWDAGKWVAGKVLSSRATRLSAEIMSPAPSRLDQVLREGEIGKGIIGDLGEQVGLLREAASGGPTGMGNYSLGRMTAAEANELGAAWVGPGYRISKDGTSRVSRDGLKIYRPPTNKTSPYATTGVQANFELKLKSGGTPVSNGHLNIAP